MFAKPDFNIYIAIYKDPVAKEQLLRQWDFCNSLGSYFMIYCTVFVR